MFGEIYGYFMKEHMLYPLGKSRAVNDSVGAPQVQLALPPRLCPCGHLEIPTKTPFNLCQFSGSLSLFSRHLFHIFLTSFLSITHFPNVS